MTRLLIPLVAAVTLALLVVWLLQESQPGSATPRDVAETSARGGVSDAAASVVASVSTPEATPDADVAAEAPAAGAAEPEVPSAGSPDAATPVDAATEPGAAASDPAGEVAADTASASLPAGVVTADAATAYVPEGYAEVEPLAAERRIAFEGAEDVLDAGLDYAAVIETNRGVFVVDLFETATPLTVNNFVFLALHRYFDGIVFHRVIDEFMAQTGDPTGTGTGGPGYRFDDEIVEELRHDGPGVLSMANAGPGTNGSQFFLTFAATPWLDGAHTVFGRIVEGLELLDGITRVDPQQPSVVALLDDPVASVRDQGIDLAGDGTVGEALTAALGAAPVPGPGYDVGGARVAIGTMSGAPAAGFFPYPDRMERVIIVARPRG